MSPPRGTNPAADGIRHSGRARPASCAAASCSSVPSGPKTVCVFPEPVWPYTNRHALNPFSTEIIEALAAEELDTKRIALSQKALQLCYDLLPDHMKRIARLRFREDSQLKDIAKKVGRPLGSVSATLHRIRINLIDCVRRKLPLVEAENEL